MTTTSNYEEKRQARIERMRERAAKLRRFAEGKDFSVFSEERSGIPLGQPILVGHHSERRHRRHLERLHRLVAKGYDALKRAEQLEQRAAAAEDNRIIQSDDPEAGRKIADRIAELEAAHSEMKRINSEFKRNGGKLSEIEMSPELRQAAESVLRHQSYYGKPFPPYSLTNSSANIRRLKQRELEIPKVQAGFDPFTVGDVAVEYVNGQVQVAFPWKPDEPTRTRLKQLAFKWSRYSSRWVRKHTATTASDYFKSQLINILAEARQ